MSAGYGAEGAARQWSSLEGSALTPAKAVSRGSAGSAVSGAARGDLWVAKAETAMGSEKRRTAT